MGDEVVEQLHQQLLQEIEKHTPNTDKALIEKAFRFAEHAHRDQRRSSGEPYVTHLIHVAIYLTQLKMDSHAVAAGLLHDTLEDTEVKYMNLVNEFGEDVAYLVDGVSKLRSIRFRNDSLYIENLRKMFIATAKDIRVIIIKLCDRLHNVRTLEYLRKEERERIARETLEIYAPIARRLQIGQIRGPLEDWSFKFLEPESYRWLYNVTRKNFDEKRTGLKKASDKIIHLLQKDKIKVIKTEKRIKHIYSLYKKLERYENDLSQIYDIVAIRVIVPHISDCYAALGIIHKEFKPMKGRIKDYIAQPKINGYRSLHTTVILPNEQIVEIQIRTPEMHEQAEFGIASHWRYKESDEHDHHDDHFAWVHELAEMLKEISDPQDLEHLKIDLFAHRIFVLTPKGDVIDLPMDSSPVDFAYHIHTDIGNKAIKAKVNGQTKSLAAVLHNGDIVEVIMDKNKKGPNIEWLDFVKSNIAKSKIKQYHKKRLSQWEKTLASMDSKRKKTNKKSN